MANATCGMKAPSVGLEIPGESFGGIPESLVVYGAVTICAVILYFLVRRLKCVESCTLGDSPPSYWDLLTGSCYSANIDLSFSHLTLLCRERGSLAEAGAGYWRHALYQLPEDGRLVHFNAHRHLNCVPRHQSFP